MAQYSISMISYRFTGFSGNWPRLAGRLAILMSVALTALPAAAQSAPLAESQRLLKQGQHAQALERIDAFLAGNPGDPQARFLRGVALSELNRPVEAIAVFAKLSEEFPELPEPYNNLAVLYAQQRQYDKARTALEMAIRTHPAYAIAHENLGDVYAKLASQAYDKALQLDSSNAAAQTKLSMIRELISLSVQQSSRPQAPVRPVLGNLNRLGTPQLAMGGRQPVLPLPDAAPRGERTQAATRPAPMVVATAPAAAPPPIAKPVASAAPAAPVAVAPAAVPPAPATSAGIAKVAPVATPPAAPSPAPTAKPAAEQDAAAPVTRALEAWADAWSAKNVKGYLAAYAPQFAPQGGQSRQAWAAEREVRVGKPGRIDVTVSGVKVTFENKERAVVRFRQQYRSANLNSTTTKTLVFVLHNGRWLIAEERVS